ncbi:MAG: hypothetical protein JWL86_1089 [Rhizobium sp.]|nr:hypothetical protein [Rhizobium sp.]
MTDGKRDSTTAYFALALACVGDDVVVSEPVQCISASAAIRCAQRLVNTYGSVGAMALRKPDDLGDSLHVLCAFGDVPYGEQINIANGWRVVAFEEEWGGVDVVG